MSHERLVTVRRRLRIGYVAIGLATVVGVVPASFAQEPQVPDPGKSAGTAIEAEERQTDQKLGNTGVSIAVPIGRVWVGPEVVAGERSYVRRTRVKEGMAIVEVSTTPFIEELPGVGALIGNPAEQPAGW